jgi:hypothetical protein
VFNCLTESKKKAADNIDNTKKSSQLNHSYQKTGWISAGKYRAVVYILTGDECKKNSIGEIEEKIKYEAYKLLQKELNPSFDRNAGSQIKKLLDNSGKIVKLDKGCVDSNIYFFDLEKNDLESEFKSIRNLKK